MAERVEVYVRAPSAYAQAAADVVRLKKIGSAVIIDRLVNRLKNVGWGNSCRFDVAQNQRLGQLPDRFRG